jgi:hypothetical protein
MEDTPGGFRRFAGVNRFRDGFRLGQPACCDMLFLGPQARGAEKRLQAYDQPSCTVVVGCVGGRAHFTGSIRRFHRPDNFTCIDDSFHFSSKLNRLIPSGSPHVGGERMNPASLRRVFYAVVAIRGGEWASVLIWAMLAFRKYCTVGLESLLISLGGADGQYSAVFQHCDAIGDAKRQIAIVRDNHGSGMNPLIESLRYLGDFHG